MAIKVLSSTLIFISGRIQRISIHIDCVFWNASDVCDSLNIFDQSKKSFTENVSLILHLRSSNFSLMSFKWYVLKETIKNLFFKINKFWNIL